MTAAVGIYLATSLIVPREFGLAAVLAVATPLAVAACRRRQCSRASSGVAAIGAAVVAVAVGSMAATAWTGYGLLLAGQLTVIPISVLAIASTADKRFLPTAVWMGASVGAIAAGSVAFVQVGVLGWARAGGATGNPISFGDAAVVLAVLALGLQQAVLADDDVATEWCDRVTWLATVGGSCAVLLSGSRGAWLAAPVIVWLVGRRSTGLRSTVSGGVAVAAVIGAATVVGSAPLGRAGRTVGDVAGYVETGSASPSAATSVGSRLEAWRTALEALVQQPWTGVGWGNLPSRFADDAAAGRRTPEIARFDHAHNVLVDASGSAGLPGMIAVAALLAVPARWFARARTATDPRTSAIGVTGLAVVASFAVFGATDAVLHSVVPVAMYAVAIGALLAALPAVVGVATPARRAPRPCARDLLAEYPTGLVGFHAYGNLS